MLGLGFEYTKQGFRKDSFAVRHRLTGMHALATEAWQFRYEGQFNDVIGKSDLLLHGLARAPHNTVNFFGFGNETVYDKDLTDPPIRYYRSRFDIYSAEVMLRTNLAQNINFAVGPSITAATLEPENNYGRYLDDFDKTDSARLYANKSYAGLRVLSRSTPATISLSPPADCSGILPFSAVKASPAPAGICCRCGRT